MDEPNTMVQVPKLDFQALASNYDGILHFDHRTDGGVRTLVVDSWTRSFPICRNGVYSREDYVHYHSGNFNYAGIQQFSGEVSMTGATLDHFQYNAGNLHMCNFCSNSGKIDLYYFQSGSGNLQSNNFQCNSGFFDNTANNAVLVTSATWPMQAVDSYHDPEHDVCRAGHSQHHLTAGETCNGAGFTSEVLDYAGIEISTVECLNSNGCTDMDNFSIDFSSAGDDGTSMIGLTTLSNLNTLVAGGFNRAHDGLQFLASCTGMQLVIVAVTCTALVCCWWHVHLQVSHLSYGGDVRSRMCRRTHRRAAIQQQRQLIALLFLCGFANARAMDEQGDVQAFLQRMTSMAEAATRAAAAAERALERSTASGAGANDGLSAASRILKSPDVYSGDDPMMFQQWKQQFTSWLCFGDSRYVEALDNLEKKAEAPPLTDYNANERDMSQKLFAVLTSYLRGRCAHLVRAESKTKDGFKLWHTLVREYMPNTRQRALALAQALGAYPVFGKDKSSLESILAFEQLVMQYEEASGSTYPLELMSATLIRCCQPKLREQLQLSINEESTYQEIRDKVLSFERVSKIWSTEQVLKHVQDQPSYSGGSADGPIPMEVDRIEKGGKGKSKGKNKGKGFSGGEWLNAWAYGRGRGRGRQNKGKGKGKSKGKSKGKKGSKGNSKGKKGGRSKVAYGQCSNCYEYGHWAKDCPNMVNQIKQEPVAPSATASSSHQPAAKASSSPVVRRIFQFGSAPSSPTSPTSPSVASQVRMVLLQDLDSDWMQISNESDEGEWVILDSGSDVSLLPSRFQPDSFAGLSPGTLQNCQGGSLRTTSQESGTCRNHNKW